MKLIITEKQLRLIVESEKEENLMDFTTIFESGISPNKWDSVFEHMNKKKGGIYDGYYINGNVDLQKSEVIELKYLVKVEGGLDLYESQIGSLPMLEYVGDYLDLYDSQIESLPMLKYVGSTLNLSDSQIKSLPMLSYVGGSLGLHTSKIKSLPMLSHVGDILDLENTPLSNKTTKEELKSKINVGGEIYL